MSNSHCCRLKHEPSVLSRTRGKARRLEYGGSALPGAPGGRASLRAECLGNSTEARPLINNSSRSGRKCPAGVDPYTTPWPFSAAKRQAAAPAWALLFRRRIAKDLACIHFAWTRSRHVLVPQSSMLRKLRKIGTVPGRLEIVSKSRHPISVCHHVLSVCIRVHPWLKTFSHSVLPCSCPKQENEPRIHTDAHRSIDPD